MKERYQSCVINFKNKHKEREREQKKLSLRLNRKFAEITARFNVPANFLAIEFFYLLPFRINSELISIETNQLSTQFKQFGV